MAIYGNHSALKKLPHTLRIASHPAWFPESGECALDGFDRRRKCRMPGYGPEILDLLLKYSGINYEIVKLPADAFGGDMNVSSGTTWNGVLGDLQNGKYDTVSAPYIITEERCASFDFSVPVNSLETIFVVGPEQPDFLTSSFRLFLIFDPTLTAAVIVALFALIIGVFISQFSHRKRNNHPEPFMKTVDDELLHDQFETSGKIFALFLGLGLLLFIGLYEGCLLTYLLLPPQQKPMTERQLLNRVYERKLTFVTDRHQYDGYGTWQLVRFSKLEKYEIFQETIKHNPPYFTNVDPDSLNTLFEEHPNDYVIYGDSSALMFAKARCSLEVVSMTDPDILRSGFVFRKNSSLVNIFNEAINRNWNFVQAVRDRYLNVDRSNCSLSSDTTQVVPLNLITLLGSFTLLGIGFSFAVFVLLLETFVCPQSIFQNVCDHLKVKLKINISILPIFSSADINIRQFGYTKGSFEKLAEGFNEQF
uniref:Solute-binding protein family 3/N-terminal domain-containing protein n=1 Tax=Plectus sambesii TaxID=2011161 RepID=A0A914V7F5_9BILA